MQLLLSLFSSMGVEAEKVFHRVYPACRSIMDVYLTLSCRFKRCHNKYWSKRTFNLSVSHQHRVTIYITINVSKCINDAACERTENFSSFSFTVFTQFYFLVLMSFPLVLQVLNISPSLWFNLSSLIKAVRKV